VKHVEQGIVLAFAIFSLVLVAFVLFVVWAALKGAGLE